MYHMIDNPETPINKPALAVSPKQFERQIRWLRKKGWHFATIHELLNNDFPKKTVAITFDDGYLNNFTYALPILIKYQAKATLYLIADREPSTQSINPSYKLLKDRQIKEMILSNLVELGAHTVTHRNLLSLDEHTQKHELVEGKKILEKRFGQTIHSFAYPYGGFDKAISLMVKDAGYESAVTTKKGISKNLKTEKYQIRRIRISGNDNLRRFKIRLKTGKKR